MSGPKGPEVDQDSQGTPEHVGLLSHSRRSLFSVLSTPGGDVDSGDEESGL